ncbi:MAG: polysaccharide deacetylase family protein [Betaproteobacteria bacterium]|nr:polysaccharide deacetylase family protein [Betaproteobacteria bacterium]
MKKYLALKIDVDTLKGTRLGVPALIDLLKKHQAGATFLFSLGPDHTGRAIKRVFRKGFLGKVKRTSVVSHYGFPTLLYGTLLPGPDIGKRCRDILSRTRDEGFEVGIHTWDHVKWQDGVGEADAAWTRGQMQLAQNRFTDIFKESARTHGAAGWQMSRHALRLTEEMKFDYCSDGRALMPGATPHFPVVNAEIIDCPQIPTTLPTLDELIGLDNCTDANVHEQLLTLTETAPAIRAAQAPMAAHVFTLHAELEGMRLLPVFDKLLAGWKDQGYELVSTETVYRNLDRAHLPYYEAKSGSIPGRSGLLLLQGRPFLPKHAEAA